MPDTAPIQTAADLLAYLQDKDALAYRYVRLLYKAATERYPVGMRAETAKEEALSDWEAAACLPEQRNEELTVDAIKSVREKLNRASELIVSHGHRDGKPTYKLNSELTE